MRAVSSLILVILSLCTPAVAQVVFSSMPLDGINGRSFFIVNYADHDTSSIVLKDHACGNKTYNGHMGTDFVLRSFKTMDSGVLVRAVASGRVFAAYDTMYDRNKRINSLGFGNYVGINHQGLYYTYYAHIKKSSLLVAIGDSVTAGQAIAQVGCSGNCTDPHVHLEVWNNTTDIDPFRGRCQSTDSLWATQPTYDTALKVIDAGFVPYVPNLDTLRERYAVRDTFYTGRDTTVCFWTQKQGLRRGDIESVYWYSPSGAYWFSYADTAQQDWWYHYNWSYIYMPDSAGLWTARYYVNTTNVLTKTFWVVKTTGIEELNAYAQYSATLSPNPSRNYITINGKLPNRDMVVYNLTGQEQLRLPSGTRLIDINSLPPGTYLLRCGQWVGRFVKQ
jgi:murein DD-endopeptidase MepM/ murein hydrolase activator NlpD